MALIIDPDALFDSSSDDGSTEVYIDTSAQTIKLNATGNLSADGVTHKALYSFLKDSWQGDPNSKGLSKFIFPMLAITEEQFEWGNNGSVYSDWAPANDTTRSYIRTGGWRELNASAQVLREYAGIISLGTLGAADTPYYLQVDGGTPEDFGFPGVVNEAVQIYNDVDGDGVIESGDGDYDYRGFFKIFCREENKTFAQSDIGAIGVTNMTYQVYRFPLTNASDIKYTTADSTIGSTSPYTEIDLRYFGSAFTAEVADGVDSNFGLVIDVGTISGVDGSFSASGSVLTTSGSTIPTTIYDSGTLTITEGTDKGTVFDVTGTTSTSITIDGSFTATETGISFILQRTTPVVATLQQIYEKIQYSLRLGTDIDEVGTLTGKTADTLLQFIGDELRTTSQTDATGGSGVYISGFRTADTNEVQFTDNGGDVREYPFVASGDLVFNSNLTTDSAAKYWLYYKHTRVDTPANFSFSNSSGATTELTSSSAALPTLAQNDYVRVEGASTAANNGIYQVTDTTPSTSSVQVTKVNGANPSDETFSATIYQDPINSPDAKLVKNSNGTNIGNALINGNTTIGWTFAYDTENEGGRLDNQSGGVDAPVVLRVIGLFKGQYAEAEFSITEATGQSFPINAPFERNYADPA